MAEILAAYPTGNTLYFLVTDSSGEYWDNVANGFEAYDAGSIGDYDVPMTEDGAVGIYRGTYPPHANMVTGTYDVTVKERAGGSPAVSDIAVAVASYTWDGTTLRLLSDIGAINTDAGSVTRFKRSIDAVITGEVVADGTNSTTEFDTDLTTENANYYGDGDGGLVIAFIQGTTNQYQTRRIIASVTAGAETRITLESALDAVPSAADEFVVLGRITELS